ncbi:type I-E CRISPR-associated protein Cse2/CasB [Nocardiopsis chromatogenes]|uniref:type I-E CRISPR-associated protein Cse2/CasB n=1 Tax=Nocardiopsis chromatogenes TaxID=280239 RepID=UPI000348F9B0|nr:type I-E CRISPR-associated protein Cse2/CasB [Nocardiopsis chromatogenes]
MEPTTETTEPAGEGAAGDAERKELTGFGQAVHGQLLWLQRGYVSDPDDPMAVQVLAGLRPGAGRLPEDLPRLLGYDYGLHEVWLDDDIPVRAAHIALSLYAVHQQSLRSADLRMYKWAAPKPEGRPTVRHNLGWAVRALMDQAPSEPEPDAGADGRQRKAGPVSIHDPVRQRFVQAGKATSARTMADRLRGLVDLLHRHRVPLDYALLAEHIHKAQQPGGISEVRRAWNFGFNSYRAPRTTDDTDKDAS